MNKNCVTCKFWSPEYDGIGVCRRRPPVVNGPRQRHPTWDTVEEYHHITNWPATNGLDWCGEWDRLPMNSEKMEYTEHVQLLARCMPQEYRRHILLICLAVRVSRTREEVVRHLKDSQIVPRDADWREVTFFKHIWDDTHGIGDFPPDDPDTDDNN